MKLKKRITLLMLCVVLASTLLLSACDIGGFHIDLIPPIATSEETTTQAPDPSEDLYKLEMQTVFEIAKDAGYTGTLEELIALFKGETGPAGENGKDGVTPHIGKNGNWWVGKTDLGVAAQGSVGPQGPQGDQGPQGPQGEQGVGIVKTIVDAEGNLVVYYTDAPYVPVVIGKVVGENGADGIDGADGVGIANVEIDADGNLVLYYTDAPDMPVVLGKVVGTDGEDGEDFIGGMAISEIEINSDGDFTITFTNGLEIVIALLDDTLGMFNKITMGVDRVIHIELITGSSMTYGTLAGVVITEDGTIILKMESGLQLEVGKITGNAGTEGQTPYIGENGNWWIGDTDTGVFAGPAACAHEYGEWIVFIEPVCKSGLKARECALCGDTEVKIMPAAHDYVTYEGREPTCYSIGWEEYHVCTICGDSNYVELPMIPHDPEWKVVTEATCTEDGYKIYECNLCRMILDNAVIEAIGHVSDGEKCVNCNLPAYTITINYVYSDGSTAFDSVTLNRWEGDSYSVTSAEIDNYIVDCPVVSGVASGNAVITVTYSPISLQEIVRIDNVAIGNVAYNTPYSALSLPTTVTGYTSRGRAVSLTVYWDSASYAPASYGEQRISGIAVAGYGYAITCSNVVYATVEVVTNVVASIDPMDLGKLPLNTTYAGLGLPTTAAVTTTTGATYYLPVSWNSYEYDPSVAGEHTISGTVSLETGFTFAEGVDNTAYITFELSEVMYGTADIVFLVDTTGSMWGEIQNVRNNIVRFAERLEREGVSVRWALLEYRDITCDGASSTKVIYCGASEWYINVHSYEKAIASLNVSGGGDRAETIIDALKAATYLESREDANTFYIAVTDADYKVNNNYGVSSMNEMIAELASANIVTSVVTKTSFYNVYRALTDGTNGILANIDGDFASELWRLCDLITEEVVYGEVSHIEVVRNPDRTSYISGDYFDGTGMTIRAYYVNGLSRDVTGYSVNPYGALSISNTEVEINYRGKIATVAISVALPEISVEGVSASVENVELIVGNSYDVDAYVYPTNAINTGVVWYTNNPNVAVVDNNGVITAIGEGETTIVVMTLDGGYTCEIYVKVNPEPVSVQGMYTDIGAAELFVGDSVTVIATVLPENATDKSLIWSSSNQSVAVVSNGTITAVGAGVATITVTTVDGGYQARIYVTVASNIGSVTGQVYSASGSTAMSNVTVKLYKNGSYVSTTTTNSAGTYSFSNLVYGDYTLEITKSDYITAEMNFTVSSEHTQLANVYLTLNSNLFGSIGGYAQDSKTASGISNITVYLRSGSGNTSGSVLYTAKTNSSGYYSFSNLRAGNYTVQFVDERAVTNTYLSTSINVTVVGGSTVSSQNGVMTLPIPIGSMEIKLSWGHTPSDLDSHLLINSGHHVYYGNKNPSGANASLDVDDTSAYGPETITVTTIKSNGKYVYYVYNYSNNGTFSGSNAVVTLTFGDEVREFRPPVGSGYYWKVFTYDAATDTLTINNQIMSSAPTV